MEKLEHRSGFWNKDAVIWIIVLIIAFAVLVATVMFFKNKFKKRETLTTPPAVSVPETSESGTASPGIVKGFVSKIVNRGGENIEAQVTGQQPLDETDSTTEVPQPPPLQSEAEIAEFRDDAIERVEAAPTEQYNEDQKEFIQTVLSTAQFIQKVETVTFDTGTDAISTTDIARLQTAMSSDTIGKYESNSKAALVILGFADQTGARDFNIELSGRRARSLETYLKDTLNSEFSIYPISLGPQDMLGTDSEQSKNRAAELWLVVQ